MKSFFSCLALGLVSIPLAMAVGCGATVESQSSTGNGTDGSGGGSMMKQETLDEACTDYAAKFCAYDTRCYPAFDPVGYSSPADCLARSKIACTEAYGRPAVTASPSDVAACADALGASSCSADDVKACDLKGSAADGAACYSYAECASGNCWVNYACTSKSGVCPLPTCGTCMAPKEVGAACQDGQCDTGLFCAASGNCAKYAALGEKCEAFGCAGTNNCVKGKCVPPRELGETCDGTTNDLCDYDALLQCDATMHCVATKVVGKGADCSYDSKTGLIPYCAGELLCDDSNHCVPTVADGGACQIDKQSGTDNCTYPAVCQNGHCSTAPVCH